MQRETERCLMISTGKFWLGLYEIYNYFECLIDHICNSGEASRSRRQVVVTGRRGPAVFRSCYIFEFRLQLVLVPSPSKLRTRFRPGWTKLTVRFEV